MKILFSTKGRYNAVNGYSTYHHLKVNTNAKTYSLLTDAYKKNYNVIATKREINELVEKLNCDGYKKTDW